MQVLNAPLAMEVELRVVVWSVRELVINGKSREIDAGGTADVLVTVQSSILLPPQESVNPNPRLRLRLGWVRYGVTGTA